MLCYNRDEDGKCLAYSGVKCSESCLARITDIDQKIRMVHELLSKANAKKLKRELQRELQAAIWIKEAIRARKFQGWMGIYFEDLHRGSGGGQSESDSNRKTGMKQLMKDNRPVGVKPTKAQQEEYKAALSEWEEGHERLERLGRSQLSSSKMDSYVGLPICLSDPDNETCCGEKTAKGELRAMCKTCPWVENSYAQLRVASEKGG